MSGQDRHWLLGILFLLVCLSTSGCIFSSNPGGDIAATKTPTTIPDGIVLTETDEPRNPCEGLTGTLELQLLVGPSEAVGLTPFAFAAIPFAVMGSDSLYFIEGNGPVEYYEEVLTAEWGTYTVQFEGDTTVKGECVADGADGVLNVNIEMAGEQIVEVVVEGVTYTYPWAGTPSLEVSLPAMNGAEAGGEGWNMILRLD